MTSEIAFSATSEALATAATFDLTAALGQGHEASARAQASEEHKESRSSSDLEQRFDDVLATIQELDLLSVWAEAEDAERRVLIEELLEWVTVYPDHLEVIVARAPPLNVLFKEVGLRESENVSVGGPTRQVCYRRLATSFLDRVTVNLGGPICRIADQRSWPRERRARL